jgi:hypothetical protein
MRTVSICNTSFVSGWPAEPASDANLTFEILL